MYRPHCDEIRFIHEHCDGREVRLGWRALSVDGYAQTSNTIYQFHDCMIHGHDCHLTRKHQFKQQKSAISSQLMEDLTARTVESTEYLKHL